MDQGRSSVARLLFCGCRLPSRGFNQPPSRQHQIRENENCSSRCHRPPENRVGWQWHEYRPSPWHHYQITNCSRLQLWLRPVVEVSELAVRIHTHRDGKARCLARGYWGRRRHASLGFGTYLDCSSGLRWRTVKSNPQCARKERSHSRRERESSDTVFSLEIVSFEPLSSSSGRD
jgi:hypothetical protein